MLHLSRFWLPGCENFALFRIVPWLAWGPCLSQNKPNTELFSKKSHVLLSNFFSFSNMLLIWLFLAYTWKKQSGVTVLVKEKRSIYFAIEVSLREISSFRTCTRSCACSYDAKIVRSRDAQCNTGITLMFIRRTHSQCNCKFLWPWLMRTDIKLQSICCVGHK